MISQIPSNTKHLRFYSMYHLNLPQLEYKLHECRWFCLFCSLLWSWSSNRVKHIADTQ